jgi:imidazole glycerol-phosphate synthase subunit HisH
MANEVMVVDYGVGNLHSVARALEHCDARFTFSSDPEQVRVAAKVILPGVGAFGKGMSLLAEKNLDEAVKESVRRGGALLGICLGMQMLLDASEEFGVHDGLGLIPGKVVAIPDHNADGVRLKIPHIGWNELLRPQGVATWAGTPLAPVAEGAAMYFVHSFMAVPSDASHRLADCRYGDTRVPAVIGRDNLWGMQFHPEKSGNAGLAVLRQFVEHA